MRNGPLFFGRILATTALFLGVAALAAAQYRGGEVWVAVGEGHVDGHTDHDKIRVIRHGPFDALRLHVAGNAVKFDHVVVHFTNGQEQAFPAAFVVQNGASSPFIDLPGRPRTVDSVELWYKRSNWGEEPRVTLFGRR